MDVEVVDGVTVVRIDHPPVNAFDQALVDDAVATVRGINGPIVRTGAGKCFSAGVDPRAIIGGPPEDTDRFLTAINGHRHRGRRPSAGRSTKSPLRRTSSAERSRSLARWGSILPPPLRP
jgi:enoyl-CoA hydratase/carnithine racemase